jgi:hypothetical protein
MKDGKKRVRQLFGKSIYAKIPLVSPDLVEREKISGPFLKIWTKVMAIDISLSGHIF